MGLKRFGSCLWMLLIVVQACTAGSCDCEGYYCVSDTEYQLCVNGETVGDRIACNPGLTCRNDREKECVSQMLCKENTTCSEEGTFPNEKFINKYFTCVLDTNTLEWIKNEYTCLDEKYFSRETKTCIIGDSSASAAGLENMKNDLDESYSTTDVIDNPKETSQTENESETSTTSGGDRVITIENPSEEPYFSRFNDFSSTTGTTQRENDSGKSIMPTKYPVISTDHPREEDYYPTSVSHLSTTYPPSNDYLSEFLCPGMGYFPDPKNCQYYYFCPKSLKAIPVSCEDNTYFDEETTLCTSEKPERCNSLQPSFNESEHQEKTIEYEMKSATPSVSPEESFVCPGYGYFPSPKNCRGYFVCFALGITVSINCPEGTYFDEQYNFCSTTMPERCNQNEKVEPEEPLEPGHEKDFVCPSFGIFPDPKDCHTYWICFNRNSGYFITCPKGTYYHESRSACLEEVPKRCREQTNELFKCTASGYFADPQDCHSYHVCDSQGLHLLIRCPRNTYFDEESQICTYDIPDRCFKTKNRMIRSTIGTKNKRTSTSEMRGQNAEKLLRQARQITEQVENSTSPETFVCLDHGLFPDPKNCSKFYTCLPTLRQLSCRPGMYYDDVTEMCEEEMPERCNDTTSNDEGVTAPPSTSASFVCPERGKFPDPNDCTKYYNCFGPSPRQLSCRPGMYFNEETKMCGEEMPERCNGTNTNDEDVTLSTTPAPFVCPERGKFPDPEDCTKYYNCFGPSPRQLSCRPGMYFNEETKMCGEEMPDRCNDTRGNEEDITILPTALLMSIEPSFPTNFVCSGRGNFPDKEDRSSYFYCPGEYFEPIRRKCPKDQHFNEYENTCFKKENDDSPSEEGSQENSEDLSSEEFQEVGFLCSMNAVTENICKMPTNLSNPPSYEKNKRAPVHERNLNFLSGQPVRTLESNPTVTNINALFPYDTTSNKATFAERAGINSTEESALCKAPGYYEDPDDCKKYYLCSQTLKQFNYTCPGKLYFNEEIRLCSSNLSLKCKTLIMGTSPQGLNVTTTVTSSYESTTVDSSIMTTANEETDPTFPPTTTTFTPPTVSQSISTNPTTSSTPQTTPKAVFKCTRAGLFPDPDDTTKYYRCNVALVHFHYSCPKNFEFNIITRKCKLSPPL